MKLPKLSPQFKRIIVIVLASLGVGMLVLLAASLQSLELKPARAFFSDDGSKSNTLSELTDVFDNLRSLTLGEAIILVGVVLCLFALVLAMLSAEGRKHLIKTIIH